MAVTVTAPTETRAAAGPTGPSGTRVAAGPTEPTGTRAAAGPTGPAGILARRWPTAAGIAATVAGLAVIAPLPERLQAWISAFGVLTAAVIYLTWGTARGDLADRRRLTAQTTAVLAFGAVAIASVVASPDAGRYVLAAGWLAHAGWDLVHHRLDRVVPRWYAEACLACDVTMATALLVLGTV